MEFQLKHTDTGHHPRSRNGKKVLPSLRTYLVSVLGRTVGTVRQVERAVHRYGGTGRRHITRSYYPIEWAWDVGKYIDWVAVSRTRRQATRVLFQQLAVFDNDTIDRYTEGWCYELALELGKHLVPEGWHIAVTNNEDHAFLVALNKGRALDIMGLSPIQPFQEKWKFSKFRTTQDLDTALEWFKLWEPGKPADCGQDVNRVVPVLYGLVEAAP